MKKTFIHLLLAGILPVLWSSCSKSNTNNSGGGTKTFSCSGISPKFSTEIQPILTSVCSINSNCHASGSTNSGGPLTTYSEVFAKRSGIREAILSGSMPQTGTINQVEINNFICWIDSGAPNN